jgi:hypothetical protein
MKPLPVSNCLSLPLSLSLSLSVVQRRVSKMLPYKVLLMKKSVRERERGREIEAMLG